LAILVNPVAAVRNFRSRLIAIAVCAVAPLCVPPLAAADQFDTLNLVMSDTLTFDANVFRTPDSAGPQPGFTSKADRINLITVQLKLDKSYALQRLQFDVSKSLTRYNAFSFLDTEALNYRGAWLWSLTPRLTGTLSADRAQAQIPFTQIGGTQRNVRTTNNRNLSVDGWVAGGWHLLAGVGQSESTTEQTVLSTPSSRSHRVEGGLRYVAASGNSITFMQRAMPSELVNQPLDPVNLIDTNYSDIESELKAAWKPTGRSSIDASLTRKARRNDHFTQRDFSGMAGELRYTWTPTGKLQVNLAANRNISPYAAFGNTIENSTYRVDQTYTLGTDWNVAAKIAVHLNVTRSTSDYGGPVFAVTAPARNDEFRSVRLSFDWTATRNASLNFSLERDRRTSNVARFEFSDTLAIIGATLNF
jgi:exopolysaccharide biosynthesis operon protein EpsL